MITIQYILKRIDKSGVTDLELGNKVGISNSTIGKWRKGGKASQDTLLKVKAWLDNNYPDFVLNDPGVDTEMERLQYQMQDIARSIEILNEKMKVVAAGLKKLNKPKNETVDSNDGAADPGGL